LQVKQPSVREGGLGSFQPRVLTPGAMWQLELNKQKAALEFERRFFVTPFRFRVR
jgi:hypothetical protein